MKVLWLCNVILPMIARQLNIEGSNKEGWISGLAEEVLKKQYENGIELSIAFPAPKSIFPKEHEICMRTIKVGNASCDCYGFYEQTEGGGFFDDNLKERLQKIVEVVKPDIVHCFGTEFAHSYVVSEVFEKKDRILIGLQGLCGKCADAYYANLPEKVVTGQTMRDKLRNDSVEKQRNDFSVRSVMENKTISTAKHITGRTEWDREFTRECNPNACYYKMNEILRPEFYGPVWDREKCIPHSIFVSQGDYSLKGLHYMLLALPKILAKYPDTTLYVAGTSLVKYDTLKNKLKITAYGKYLRKLMKKNRIEEKVSFVGRLNAEQMCERYLKSNLFVCCSTVENSPNSLGEAMLLGMPCVTADVGGIPSIFAKGEDGIMYEGFRVAKDITRNQNAEQLKTISNRLAKAVLEMWGDPEKMGEYCRNARNHASKTHNKERNYQILTEIYAKIISESN